MYMAKVAWVTMFQLPGLPNRRLYLLRDRLSEVSMSWERPHTQYALQTLLIRVSNGVHIGPFNPISQVRLSLRLLFGYCWNTADIQTRTKCKMFQYRIKAFRFDHLPTSTRCVWLWALEKCVANIIPGPCSHRGKTTENYASARSENSRHHVIRINLIRSIYISFFADNRFYVFW